MRTLSAVAGAALLVWNLAGLARAEVPCGQTLDAPLRPGAVLRVHSRPAGLEIVGTAYPHPIQGKSG
jgi:Asp-tRNA(Asn)/Glu-tRNA(Gln) amidotransferase A subunit family amidase